MAIPIRQKIVIAAIIFYATFAWTAAAHAAIIKPANNLGLVGYWNLDEGKGTTAFDHSSSPHNGTLTTGPTWATGKLGQALTFGAANNYVVTTAPWPSSGSISIWVYPTTYADWISPAGWKTDPNTSTDGYMLFDEGGAGTPGKWRFVARPNVGGAAEAAVVASASITQNTWQHIVGTWSLSGTTYTTHLYVNGVDQGTNTWTGTPGASGLGGFNFGKSGDFADNYFKGKVDDVRIYNRALPLNEVQALYNRTAGTRYNASANTLGNGSTVTNGLVGWWTFDGGNISGTTATDRSGLGNSGTLTGATTKMQGKLGQALNFDGSNSYINIPDSASLRVGSAFTFSAWIKPGIISGCGSVASPTCIIFNKENSYEWAIASNGTIVWAIANTSPGWAWESSTLTVPSGVWTHVVITYDGSHVVTYKNGGASSNSQSASGTVTDALTTALRIAARGAPGAASAFFPGAVDDVRVYNHALSAVEARQLYQEGAAKIADSTVLQNGATLTQGLLGYWSMNGADVTNKVYDRTGGNNGYFVGGATSTAKVQGKLGQALHFNGNLQYVSAPGSYPTGTSPRTLCAWAKSDDTSFQGNADHVVNYGTADTAQAFGFMIFTGNRWWFFGFGGSYDFDSGIAADTKWHYHCVTYNGATVTYYYDGTSAASAARSLSTTANNMTFGIRPDLAASNEFNGSIDEVRLYNRALSAVEVKQLYQLGK